MKIKARVVVIAGIVLATSVTYMVWSHKPASIAEVERTAKTRVTGETKTFGHSEPTETANAAGGNSAKTAVSVAGTDSPRDILSRLKGLKALAGQPQGARLLLRELDALRAAGTAAVPEIRAFLASGEDADFDAKAARASRGGRVPTEFVVPPSLRLGLFEVLKDIGGPGAEEALTEALKTTGRGLEVAYLAGALQSVAGEKYRDMAVSAAKDLLAMPPPADGASPLYRADREYLFGVLASMKDISYVERAQAQVVLPNGRIDQASLRYLQQSMGEKSLAVATRLWEDSRIPIDQKEPVARLALNYVGANPQANGLFHAAISDPNFDGSQRQNLIEDLNEVGFADPKHLTAADLPLLQQRIALIEQTAPRATDATNAAAFREAYKDLVKMRDDLLRQLTPK